MPMEPNTINREAVCFELEEAKNAINTLMEQVRAREHDADESLSPLSVEFQHIVSHLCRAWHSKWMSDEDIDSLSQAEYDDMSDSIPNWGLSFRLVDIEEPRRFDRRSTKQKGQKGGRA